LVRRSAPIVVASLVGVVVALVQAATQLQEQTLQYTLKFIAIVFTLFATGSFLAGSLQAYGDRIFSDFSTIVRR
jgi:type III secretion protein S